MAGSRYFDLFLNPLGLLRTKEVLQVNPTVSPVRPAPAQSRLFVFDFDAAQCVEREVEKVSDCFAFKSTPTTTWINVDGFQKEEVEALAAHYDIHPLVVEDILSMSQRPKSDEINGLIFCVLNMLYFNEKEGAVETEQISLVLGPRVVISFQEDPERDVFNGLREKIRLAGSKVRQHGADFLFYMLIDTIVDHYYIVMERLADRVEQLEEDIIRQSNARTLVKINNLRKEMILLRRSIGPVRELVHGILRSENPLIEDRTEKYFKDVYDHIVQANELAENHRDMMINMHDLYMNNMNLRLNEVMKVMAIVTCLLAPATVIGGIFGMNFDRIPLLHNKWGFFVSVGCMVFVPILMMYYFKKRKWF